MRLTKEMHLIFFLAGIILAGVNLLSSAGLARAQDMEPRAYSASPVGTNFLVANYLRTTGTVSISPAIPVTNVKASINIGSLGYERTFDVLGRTASAGIVLPYVSGFLSGNLQDTSLEENSKKVSRSGLADLGLRFAVNLIGNPALTPAEFAHREPTTTLGASVSVMAPTGDYDPQHLINISANRWAFKPEIGVSQPIGNWFTDAAAGVWVYTDNTNFFGGHVFGQDPIWSLQVHGGYNFSPGLWLAVDGTQYSGGNTTLNDVSADQFQVVTRYGLTLSVPFGHGLSAKAAWSTWLTAHNGGGFNTIALTLQYRWFDP